MSDPNNPMMMVYFIFIPAAIGLGFLMWRETWPSIKERRKAEQLEREENDRLWEAEREQTRREMAAALEAGKAAERRHHALSMKPDLSASEATQLTALTARLGYGNKTVVYQRERCNDGWWGD